MKKTQLIASLILLSTVTPVIADVRTTTENGFTVHHSIEVAAAPDQVYKTITNHINEWWDGAHSWSGNADNLYMDTRIGGCYCENLPDGGKVEHLRIVYLLPGKEIRFDGALGPLQQMPVQGRMIWKIEAREEGSTVSFTYHVHGHVEGGFAGLAPAVDGVIGEQLAGLEKRLAGN
jgi:hypothetical protein